ncbi:hypothetical protein CHS0354_035906 [Potamilus streckersoni]|uniref:Uncharacterized protein n=1 Tax=Potamilus streckersoni TaxID=2493646 RepID=A0AAE0SFI9_9BIVA|nr:hypothetical protein CHS0354_035906 [Potamilus streckersoni]
MQLAILTEIIQTTVLHRAIIGLLSLIHKCCRKHVFLEYYKRNLLTLLWQCTATDMEVCTRDFILAVCMAIVLMCSFVNYICHENVVLDEVAIALPSRVIVFECNHGNVTLHSRNLRETLHSLWNNYNMIPDDIVLCKNILDYPVLNELHTQNVSVKPSHNACMGADIVLYSLKIDGRRSVDKLLTNERRMNDVTTFVISTFNYFIPITRSRNDDNLDKLRAFVFCVVKYTYNSRIVLETSDVRSQPLPSTCQLTQHCVKVNVLRLVSSKQKINGKETKIMQAKSINLKALEINRKMFAKYSVVVRDEASDRKGNEKHDIYTSHALAYLDDTNLQQQNASVNLYEGNIEKVDLQRRKKRSHIHILLPHLEKFPQPHVHQEVVVGFLSGEYSKSPGDATGDPTEHEMLGEILKRLASDENLGPQITMQFEILRLCTLKNYPRENKPFAVRLVAAGFYYAGHMDQLICYCCAIRKNNWVGGDIPILIHQEMSPSCSFLTNNVSVNIPMKRHPSAESPTLRLLAIQKFQGSNQSDVAQSESSLLLPSCEQKRFNILNTHKQMLVTNNGPTMIQLNGSERQNVLENRQTLTANTESVGEPPPKYPQYAVSSTRINSFQNWPEESRQRPEEMAECGFYYAGFSDCVRCFYCGVGLRHWMSEDDPWIEHTRWSSSCRYVLKMKGEEFVSLVKMAVEIVEREANRNTSGEDQASTNNQREVTVTAKSEDTKGSITTAGAVGDATSSTSSSSNADIQKYLLTDAAQSVLDMGYQPKMVLWAIERVLMKKDSDQLTAQNIMEAVLDIEEEGGKIQPPPFTPGIGLNNVGATADGHETEVGAIGNEHNANQETDPEMICKCSNVALNMKDCGSNFQPWTDKASLRLLTGDWLAREFRHKGGQRTSGHGRHKHKKYLKIHYTEEKPLDGIPMQ